MRIVQICPYDIDRPGGVQRHICDLAAALHSLGHETTIISPRRSGVSSSGAAHGIPVVEASAALSISINHTAFEVTWPNRAHLARAGDALAAADIVHFHTIATPFMSWFLLPRARTTRVATFHDLPPSTAMGRAGGQVYWRLSRALFPRLDGIILTNPVFKRHLQLDYAREWTVLPPSTDLAPFRRAAPRSSAASPVSRVLFLGRLERRKGVDTLLRAYGNLERAGSPMRLTIAGEGGDRARLMRLHNELGLSQVEWLGEVSPQTVPELMAASDIFCAPSHHGEGFGIVLMEAVAAGCGVVAADNEGYRHALAGGPPDCLFPAGDAGALERRLAALHEQRQAGAPQGGLAEAARAFDIESVAPQLVRFYAQAAAGRARRAA